MKFSCPHCQQHIDADASYAGIQINCPACNGGLIVPGTPPAPAPEPVYAPPPPPLQPQVSAQTQAPAQTGFSCPSCGAAMGRGAVLCQQCGYNKATGRRMGTASPGAGGRSAAPEDDVWYKTPYPYLGGFVLLLAVLYMLGQHDHVFMLGFLVLCLLYAVGVQIIVIVAAFKEGAGTGFLTMCVPFYSLYFVYKVNENRTLSTMYTLAVVINLVLRFLPGITGSGD